MDADWRTVRTLFPILARQHYMAACSHGPLSTPVENALNQFMASWREEGNAWESDWMPAVADATERYARFVNAPPQSVGINSSVSAAIGAILSAIDFRDRRHVVASALDFPTLPDILLAYQQQGAIDLEILPARHGEIPLEAYERAITRKTALVCLSSASYATGARFPVKAVAELAKQRGAFCLVDAFQTAGALALDVQDLNADFVVTGTLKYLLGAMGVAMMYVAPEVAERLAPRNIGWHAAANPFGTDFDRGLEYAPGAARFQSGTFSVPGCYAARAALDLLLEIGADAIEARVLELSRAFANGLEELGISPTGPTDPGKLGPMVAVPVPGDAHDWQERLRHEERVVTAARGNSLRFAFHFYNDADDVAACLDVVGRRLRD